MSHFFSSGRLGTGVDSVAVSGSVRGSRSALRVVALVAAAALSLGACALGTKNNSQASNEPISGEKGSVNLVTYDSFALSEETLALFTKESGYQVKVIKSGDGACVSRSCARCVLGKAITSRIDSAPVISVTMRSRPKARPPCGGAP